MFQIDPNAKISPQWVMDRLMERRPTTSRFSIPATTEQIASMLTGAVMAEVARHGIPFVANHDLENQIELMSQWLAVSDYRCCCLLSGLCGNGKSTLVRALQQLVNWLGLKDEHDGQRWQFRIIDAKEIAWMCRDDRKAWHELHHAKMLAIDDLGTEPVEVQDYGNRQNPVIDLLYKRYDNQLTTIITTNLLPSQISETYGERIADRLREMAFRIVFENESYRKLMQSQSHNATQATPKASTTLTTPITTETKN